MVPGFLGRVLARRGLMRAGLLLGGAVALATGAWFARDLFVRRAVAQPAPSGAAIAEGSESSVGSDYTTRVVAYVYRNQPITRQDLGEYLIARCGYEKLPLLLNKRVTEDACRERGIVVTAAEVEAAFLEDLKGMSLDRETFIKTVLSKYKKNLLEWKEDVLKPRLQMTRLVQSRLSVSQEDLRKAYESAYGEKVECRLILWPLAKEQEALDLYGKLRASEAEFDAAARKQETGYLAATGGRIKPISRWAGEKVLEDEAYRLQPGQVSTLVKTAQGIVLLKCDKRIPPDTTVNFDTAKPKLEAEIREHKLQLEMASAFHTLKEEARPRPLLQKQDRAQPGPVSSPTQVVAYLHGSKPVTREELGEFLIARYGGEKLELLVNRRIIDVECAARKIVISDEDVDRSLEADLKMLQCDKKHFEKELLAKWGKNLFEWREDVVRPRMMLTQLCHGRVKVTDEDLQKGFEAYHGERLECRVILWPPEQAKYAMTEYARLRDSEAEFATKAKNQPSPQLATHGGRIPVFGRHTLGDENLEREAFKLQPGEISTLIGTPQGQVVIKCDRRIPPDKDVKLEQVKEKLTKEIHDKKVNQEMQVAFKELKDKAQPQLILKWSNRSDDLLAETQRLMSDLPPLGAGATAATGQTGRR